MSAPRVSSFCSGGDCLAVEQMNDGAIKLTCTRYPILCLYLTPDEWSAFLAGAKAGEFDDLEALA